MRIEEGMHSCVGFEETQWISWQSTPRLRACTPRPSSSLQRMDGAAGAEDLAELLQAELHAGLHGAEGGMGGLGDFALAHALQEGQLDHLLLRVGQQSQMFIEHA